MRLITISLGNDRADRAAKYAAQNGPPNPFSTQFLNLSFSLIDIINYQANPPDLKKTNGYKNVQNNCLMDYTLNWMDFLLLFYFKHFGLHFIQPTGTYTQQGKVKKLKDNWFSPDIHLISRALLVNHTKLLGEINTPQEIPLDSYCFCGTPQGFHRLAPSFRLCCSDHLQWAPEAPGCLSHLSSECHIYLILTFCPRSCHTHEFSDSLMRVGHLCAPKLNSIFSAQSAPCQLKKKLFIYTHTHTYTHIHTEYQIAYKIRTNILLIILSTPLDSDILYAKKGPHNYCPINWSTNLFAFLWVYLSISTHPPICPSIYPNIWHPSIHPLPGISPGLNSILNNIF